MVKDINEELWGIKKRKGGRKATRSTTGQSSKVIAAISRTDKVSKLLGMRSGK